MTIWQKIVRTGKIALGNEFPPTSPDFEQDFQRARAHGCEHGSWGTSHYYIDGDHNMYIGRGELQGRLYDAIGGSRAHDLNTVHIMANVRAPQDSSRLFSVTDEIYTSEQNFLSAIDGIDRLDTTHTTDMHGMFANDYLVESLDLSNWDTGNVQDMSQMFHNLASLRHLNVSGWNTGNVVTMRGTFAGMNNLKTLDINLWNTHKVQDMAWMFTADSSLNRLDLSRLDMSHVQDVNAMFLWMDQSTKIKIRPHIHLTRTSSIDDKTVIDIQK